MPQLIDWVAHMVGGSKIWRKDASRLSAMLSPGSVEEFHVFTDSPLFREILIDLDHKRGNFARSFTRRMHQLTMNGGVGPGMMEVTVLEVIPDPSVPTEFVRLYLLPDGRLILSTKDLYW